MAQEDGQSGTFTLIIPHDGLERHVQVHLPAERASEPIPLVIALHPLYSSGRAMEAITGLSVQADARGFAAAYPDTAQMFWDDGRVQSGFHERVFGDLGGTTTIDDVGFIRAIIDTLSADYGIDREQVYVTGLHNGASLVYRLACETPNSFAGFAVVGALMWDYVRDECETIEAAPVNLLLVRGTSDPIFPSSGRVLAELGEREDGSLYASLGTDITLNFWAERLGCTHSADTPNTREYSGCIEGASLRLYRVLGGGHNWSQGGERPLNNFGVNTTEIILNNFFGGEWQLEQAAVFRDTPRQFFVYAPESYDPERPTPLVIALHGRPGSGTDMAAITDMNSIADNAHFLVAYPDGIEQGWNSVGDLIGDPSMMQDDVQFMRDLVAELSLNFNIDPTRVYVTGFSNGGFMTHRLACEASDVFAAFAAVGSSLYYVMRDVCDASPPVPMLIMHGTEDVSIGWDGVRQMNMIGEEVQVSYSVPDTALYWAAHNGCNPEGLHRREYPMLGQSTGTQVLRADFVGCAENVRVYLISGGGHNWAGVPGVIGEEIAGRVNMDIHASREIWTFFSEHRLEEATADT